MSNVGVGCMITQHDHWFSCAAVVTRSLFVVNGIVDDVVCPVKVSVMVKEACDYVCSRD